MKLLIAGDLTLQDRAAHSDWNEIALQHAFHDVKKIIDGCDHAIVNLESPITNSVNAIIKDGPSLKNAPAVIQIIKYCGFDTVTLANNHLMDYGKSGVMDTISICKENEFNTVGAGQDLLTARKPLILKKESDITIGIINVCEHESSISTDSNEGSNPLEFSNLYYDIQELKELVDKIIVIIHGGREHYQLPTPRMKRDYHLIADWGGDVIVNHHQHCYSGYEIYNGKPIFYGLGNFFFDNPRKREDNWNHGIMIQLDLTKEHLDYNIIPYEQCNVEAVVEIEEYEAIKLQINELNSIISDDNKLAEAFDIMVFSSKPLSSFLPFGNRFIRSLYYRGLCPLFISKRRKALIKNSISCETHREIILHYLNKELSKFN